MNKRNRIDITIAGGGLAGSLIAWRLKTLRPELNVMVFEQGESLGGQHRWSFHETDVTSEQLRWLEPLIEQRWPSQQVIFPDYQRSLSTPYYSITSTKLAEVLSVKLKDNVFYNNKINSIYGNSINYGEDEEIIESGAVIDCLGDRKTPHLDLGFQKFVGQEIRFVEPHGVVEPIIMDASVPQLDGYRFVYVLPLDDHTALIEDTRYADGDDLELTTLRQDISAYVASKGWSIDKVLSEEQGVLPIALGGDMEAFWPNSTDERAIARAGMAAALFHPLTGYSLPHAVKLADKIAAHKDLSAQGLFALTRSTAMNSWHDGAFYRLLCRMLFRAAEPDQRYKVLQRFYKLPQGLIERFYAGVSPLKDKARILVGKPPVPISKAVTCLRDKKAASSAK